MSATAVKERPITVKKLAQHLGAEILGVDLSQPLSDDDFAKVSKAFFDNQVVVFRNQKITPEQQIAFTRRFGVLEQHVRKALEIADRVYVMERGRITLTGRADELAGQLDKIEAAYLSTNDKN